MTQNLEEEEECIGEDIGRKVADRLLCVHLQCLSEINLAFT